MNYEQCRPYIHENYKNEKCEFCNLDVNEFGNTEESFDFCQFPACGCDGARLCMAKNGASLDAVSVNVEGMWNENPTKEQRIARETLRAAEFFTQKLIGE
jgi:hypothetical protein